MLIFIKKIYKGVAGTMKNNYLTLELVHTHLSQVKKAIDEALISSDETVDLNKFREIQGILDKSRKQSFSMAYPEWSQYA